MNSTAVYSIDLPTLEAKEFYYFLTGNVYTALSRRLQKNFKRAGIDLTNEQWSILYALWNEEGLTQQELAQRTFREKTAVTRLIHHLEKDELVIRVSDRKDNRINLVFLTKKGRYLKAQCMIEANRTVEEALCGLSAEDVQKVRDILSQVYQNLT